MKTLVLAAVLAIAPACVMASEWTVQTPTLTGVGVSTSGYKEITTNTRRLWVRYTYPDQVENREVVYLDCANYSYQVTSNVWYARGQVAQAKRWAPGENVRDILPGGTMEALRDKFCF